MFYADFARPRNTDERAYFAWPEKASRPQIRPFRQREPVALGYRKLHKKLLSPNGLECFKPLARFAFEPRPRNSTNHPSKARRI